ncbi:hypothetical protein [Endozoicomonas sp. ALC066]|uniref:hypothetical protein n=1 Tax=Endozoicomonas sp. ALC066 TaxID=3403078 RepID=UPI003BB5C7FC
MSEKVVRTVGVFDLVGYDGKFSLRFHRSSAKTDYDFTEAQATWLANRMTKITSYQFGMFEDEDLYQAIERVIRDAKSDRLKKRQQSRS